MGKLFVILIAMALLLLGGAFVWQQREAATAVTLHESLQTALIPYDLTPLVKPPAAEPAKVRLGEALFFDKELSGNRDTSCATCHHPQLATGDQLTLSIGTGSNGLGAERRLAENRDFVPRHATELFNRGLAEWNTMFWEGRVAGAPHTGFDTPAGDYLPDGLESALAAQAMFPVTIRTEMRGGWYSIAGYAVEPGTIIEEDSRYDEPSGWADTDVFGQANELAGLGNQSADFPQIWVLLMQRLLALPGYQTLFAAAYPDIPQAELGFEHAANAIAAYEATAFTAVATPWDRYLAGETAALDNAALRGALLFYGKANCAACHSGPLLTDQAYHNIAAPQFGPGRDDIAPLDYGRYAITQDPADRYAFRTPPLRNVALTGPWLHNGAYDNLEDVLRHHLQPAAALRAYAGQSLPPALHDSLQNHPVTIDDILQSVSPQLGDTALSDQEIDDLLAFLNSLTDPAAENMGHLIPDQVPSGLPVGDG